MNSREPGVSLLEALHGLERTVRELRLATQQRYEPRLESLQHVVASLGLTTTARSPRVSDEYLQDWQRYLADPQQRLTLRALRYLCWEPEVAMASRFQDYLDQAAGELGARALQGLVRSYHARWSPTFASGAVARRVQQRLAKYRGMHRVLARWREHAAMLLGPQGHCLFADSLLAAQASIKTYCDEWAIEESSQYILEALRQAVRACQERLGHEAALQTYLLTTLLPWTGWPVQDFHAVVGATILHPATARNPGLQEALIKVVLFDPRLGDPRLPRNAKNWLGVQEARQRFLQWLSRADINFFFEHVLPRGKDPHDRKAFWLRYVPRVLMSRPLLNRDDEGRIRVTLQSLQEQIGHFGHIHGATSAFLLDFGPLVVVEFSQAGNACYLYEKSSSDKVIADFWSPETFTVWGLKRRSFAVETIAHRAGWQTTLAHFLAQYGIRPA
jgi:EH_Signature domain